jgi:hypothetical protein
MRGRQTIIPPEFAEVSTLTRAELAARYGVSILTITRWRAKVGRVNKGNIRHEVPADFREFAPGKTIQQLKTHYRVGENAVQRWRKLCDIKPVPKTGPAADARRVPAPEDLAERYRELGSMSKLQAHYKRDFNTVKRWVVEAGLPVNKSGWPATLKSTITLVRPTNGHVALPARSLQRAPLITGREQEAAQHLRRFYPAVYRCAETGRADPKGTHWRIGNAVVEGGELLERAYRRGFDPDGWRRVA